MSRTGYSARRAAPHERFLEEIRERLFGLGYSRPLILPPDGDKPDMRLGDGSYIDAKTRKPHHQNYSVKVGSFHTYFQLALAGEVVFIVWDNWKVDTPVSAIARIEGGPTRPTGNGSKTDYYLVKEGGTPFKDWFLPMSVSSLAEQQPVELPPDENPF
jgi:hypothetical protein